MLLIASVLTLLIWIYLLALRGAFWRMKPDRPPPAGTNAPRVAIVVPARNEATCIGAAVASLCRQDYGGPFHIFVVNDHSTDGTAAAIQSGTPELVSVLDARTLASGWTGKVWAMAEGVEAARRFAPHYYLFTDADIVHSPDNLAGLVAKAEQENYDLVSHMVLLHCQSLAERLLIPPFVYFFFQLYPPSWTSDARRTTAGAAGGCLLLRARALERAGGLHAIRGAIIDDCSLAAAVKRAGGRLWLGLSPATRSIRPYAGFSGIGGMIARTAYTQLRYSPLLLVATLVGMALTYLLPPLLLFHWPGTPALLGAVAYAMMSASYLPALRLYRQPLVMAPLLPLAALFYASATFYSAIGHWRGRGGAWKGRYHTPGKKT